MHTIHNYRLGACLHKPQSTVGTLMHVYIGNRTTTIYGSLSFMLPVYTPTSLLYYRQYWNTTVHQLTSALSGCGWYAVHWPLQRLRQLIGECTWGCRVDKYNYVTSTAQWEGYIYSTHNSSWSSVFCTWCTDIITLSYIFKSSLQVCIR